MDCYQNLDITNIITPIKVNKLKQLLVESNYDKKKTDYLIGGFEKGFDISYHGPINRRDVSDNIPIWKGVRSLTELWNKVMKEVHHQCYAGPFQEIPFDNYMQSPIGLVPKDNGKQIRLIFHLSYDFKTGNQLLNYHTPDHLCKVKYRDLDHVVSNCLELISRIGETTIFNTKIDV